MLRIRELRKEMKAMHKKIGKLEDHRNTQHATEQLSLRQHLSRMYNRECTQSAHIRKIYEI